MKAWSVILFFVLSVGMASADGNPSKNLFRIEHATPDLLQLVTQSGLEVNTVRGLGSASRWRPNGMAEIEVWLSAEELAFLRDRGVQPVPIVDRAHEEWLRTQESTDRERDYHNYAALTSLLQSYAESYPNICRLYSIGHSVQGRELWVMKITDNPDLDEDEPEFKYVSTMHGNEPLGVEMLLYLLDDLLTDYGTDAQLTNLVDNVEIHLLPMMNPDGNAAGTRTNANGVDLNRNFPDPYTSPNNTGVGRQAETAAVMAWTQAKDFCLSANFHTGALLVNYPYDNNASGSSVYTISPDDDLFIQLSETYSSTNLPMWSGEFTHGITNGAAWYAMSGGMQDWNYRYEGGMEVTVELSDSYAPPASQLPTYWANNRSSLINYLSWCLRGVRGVVTSSTTGQALAGVEVRVAGRDVATWTAAQIGDYHRILPAGSYTLVFSKAGYVSQTIPGIVVGTGAATRLDVVLQPLVAAPDFALEGIQVADGGNGRLDPGESATLQVAVTNMGTTMAAGTTASLQETGSLVDVLGGSQTLGDLAPGQTAIASFSVSVHPDAASGSVASFELAASCAGLSETLPFSQAIGLVVEDFESGTLSAWPWLLSGNAGWTISSSAYEGAWSARSGVIGHSQTSRMALSQTFLAPGEARFMARVSSETNYDFLKVYVDGVVQLSLSGNGGGWSEYAVTLSAGEHTLLFSYEKDGNTVGGDDAVYVDFLQLPPVAPTPRPDLLVEPAQLTALLAPGGSTVRTLTLGNQGAADLAWSASLALDDPALAGRTVDERKLAKGEWDPRSSEADRNAGGPDAFGYNWIDSRSTGGPSFAWVDMSAATQIPSEDDANTGPYDLGFTMPFYGNSYSSVRISTNGFLSFTDTESAYNNAQMPGTGTPNNLVAPFWDDLNPTAGGSIWYWADTAQRRFVVEFRAVRHYSGTATETFQAILEEDGDILFQYQSVGSAANCSVGIENAAGTTGLGLCFNTAGFLVANLAIRFVAPQTVTPWAVLSPLSGTVAAGGQSQLSLTLSAEDLEDGVYTGGITLVSNDPDTPTLLVPLTLTVLSHQEPVTDLRVVADEGQITLSWSAVPGATGYRIYRRALAASDWTWVGTVAVPGWSQPHAADEGVRYRVTATH